MERLDQCINVGNMHILPFSRNIRADFESSRLRGLDAAARSVCRETRDTFAPAPRIRKNIVLGMTLDIGRERAIARGEKN